MQKVLVISKFSKELISLLEVENKQYTFSDDLITSLDATILVASMYDVDMSLLEKLTNLKHIQLLSSGYNNIELEYLKKRNISLNNAKDIYSPAIAQYVIANTLAYYQHIIPYYNQQRQHHWERRNYSKSLFNKKVVIVGAGSIGKEVAKLFKFFNCQVFGYKNTIEQLDNFDQIFTTKQDLEKTLQIADIVVVALPLNENTNNFFTKQLFSLMRKDALFINIARGEVVNENDLYNSLKNKEIAHAIIDVTIEEPLPSNNKLWELDNITITPHSSNQSEENLQRLFILVTTNLQHFYNKTSTINKIL